MTAPPEHPTSRRHPSTPPGRRTPAQSSELHEPGPWLPTRGWERVLVVLAVCLPVPLFGASGMTIPLPAVVERVAAALVPWADAATAGANGYAGARGRIVLVPADGRGTETREQGTVSAEAGPTRDGSKRAVGGSGGQAATQGAGAGAGEAPGADSGPTPTEPREDGSGGSGADTSGDSGTGKGGSPGGETTNESDRGSSDDSDGGSSDSSQAETGEDGDEKTSDDSGLVEETVDTVGSTTDKVGDTADDAEETVDDLVDEVGNTLPGLGG